MTRLPLFCCALIVLAVRGDAQPAAPLVRLTQPELEHPLGFTSVLSVAELSGDKAIVVARDPAGPSLVDLRSGGLLAIGHKGQGPGEWAVITGVFGATGDTAFLFDAGRGVVMSVVGGGWPSQVGRATGNVVQVDTALRAYYVGVGGAIAMAAAASASTGRAMVAAQAVGDRRDSMAIVRVDLRANKRDTIGYRRYEQGWGSVSAPVSADGTEPIGSAGAGFSGPGVFGSHTPFDLVAAARDGRVALLRQPEYRVEWIQPDGRRIIGPPIPHTDARLNAADIHAMEYMCWQPGMHCGNQTVRPVNRSELPDAWPTAKSAQIAPNGELWLERWRNADDSIPTFDIVDGRGVLVRGVQLPKGTRLVGLGKGTVYAVRTDQDDLEYVQRYRLP